MATKTDPTEVHTGTLFAFVNAGRSKKYLYIDVTARHQHLHGPDLLLRRLDSYDNDHCY